DNLADAYQTIRNELAQYGSGLDKKPELVGLTKMDALGEELAQDQAKTFENETGIKPFVFSSLSQEGLKLVLYALSDCIREKEKQTEEGVHAEAD
ncbi:MAG: GTPase ObgE, partial [Pseudomonadota bacterium]